MTELDDILLPEVVDICATYGKSLTFDVTVGSVYDYTTGKLSSTGTTTQYAVLCTPPAQFKLAYIDGDVIRVGDLQTLIPARDITFTPARNMKVTFDARAFTVLSVTPIYSGDSVCAWKIHMRGGA